MLHEKFLGKSIQDTKTPIEIEDYEKLLKKLGYDIIHIKVDKYFRENLLSIKPDLAFKVICAEEAIILEDIMVPYIGSDASTAYMLADKSETKKRLLEHNLPTTPFFIISNREDYKKYQNKKPFDFPMFVKPIRGGSSIGIDYNSKVNSNNELLSQSMRIVENMGQSTLVEPYIKGKELSVGIIGNNKPIILPFLEIENNIFEFLTYEIKEKDLCSFYCPARISPNLEKKIRSTMLETYKSLGLKDYARIDLIVDEKERINILECNVFPGLINYPEKDPLGYIGKMTFTLGWPREELLKRLIEYSIKRQRKKSLSTTNKYETNSYKVVNR